MAEQAGSIVYKVEVDNQSANRSLKTTRQELNKTADSAKKAEKSFLQMNVSAKNLDKLGDASLKLTKKVLKLGAAIGAAGVAAEAFAFKQAVEFESAFAGVRKTVEATEDQFATLRQELLDLSAIKPFDVGELARIEELGGQLGIATENLTGFTDTIAQVTVTTDLMADSASKDFARIFNITNESQENFERFGSTIVDLGNNFATTESEIVALTNRLAPTSALLNISTARTAGLATALSSLGIPAERGGTAFQRLGTNIFQATQQGGEDLELFAEVAGQSSEQFVQSFQEDAASAISAFLEGIGRIKNEGGNVISVLDKLQLSDVRLASTVLALANNTELLNDALATSSNAWQKNTALQEEAEKRFSTTESKFKTLQSRIRVVAIDIGDKLLPSVNEKIDQFTAFLDENGEEIDQFVNDAVAFGEALIDGIGKGAEIAVDALQYLKDNADELGNTLKSGALIVGLTTVVGQVAKLRILLAGSGGLTAAFVVLAGVIGFVAKEYLDMKSIQKQLIDQTDRYAKRNRELSESFKQLAEESEGETKTLNSALAEQTRVQAEIQELYSKRAKILEERSIAEILEDEYGAIDTYREREVENIDKEIEQLEFLADAYNKTAEKASEASSVELESQKEILRDQVKLAKRQIELGDEVFQERKKIIEKLKIDNTELNEAIFDGEIEITEQRKKLIEELEITNVRLLNSVSELEEKTFKYRIKLAKDYNIENEKLIVDLLNIQEEASVDELKIRASSYAEQQKLTVQFYQNLAKLRQDLFLDEEKKVTTLLGGISSDVLQGEGFSLDRFKGLTSNIRNTVKEYRDGIISLNEQANESIKALTDTGRNAVKGFTDEQIKEFEDKYEEAQQNVIDNIKDFVRENGEAQRQVREDIQSTREEINELAEAYKIEELQARIEYQQEAADIIIDAEKEILELEKEIQNVREEDDTFDRVIDKIERVLEKEKEYLERTDDRLKRVTSEIEDSIKNFATTINDEIGDVNENITSTITKIEELTDTFNTESIDQRLSYQQDATKIVIDALAEIDRLQQEIKEGKESVYVSEEDVAELQKQLDEQLEILEYNKEQNIVSAEEIAEAQQEANLSPLEALKQRFDEEEKARQEAFKEELEVLEDQKRAYETQLETLKKEQSDFYDNLEKQGSEFTRLYDEELRERERIDIESINELITNQERLEARKKESEREITRTQRELRRTERDKEREEHKERIAELQEELNEQLRIIRTNESEQIVSQDLLAERRRQDNLDKLTGLQEIYETEKAQRKENYEDELATLQDKQKENIDTLVDLERVNKTYYEILKKYDKEFSDTYIQEIKLREETYIESLKRQINAFKNGQKLMQNINSGSRPGFSSGGYTQGGVAQVAGVVHGGEYVAPAWQVNSMRPIFDTLESMRTRGYSEGGHVTNNNQKTITMNPVINNSVNMRAVFQEAAITLGR